MAEPIEYLVTYKGALWYDFALSDVSYVIVERMRDELAENGETLVGDALLDYKWPRSPDDSVTVMVKAEVETEDG